MLTIDREESTLLIIDFQSKLMPAIHESERVVQNAKRLIEAAKLLEVPILFTEQNAKGLGNTISELAPDDSILAHKMYFDACREPGFLRRLKGRPKVIVAGCEAHVCVQQTVLGLLHAGRQVYVVRDALGARHPENKESAIRRMERHCAEIVTTEMVVFEWLATANHPRFREAIALIK
jgi:nicotinamidase-related amidase